jgi:hypothetical protein
LVLQKKAVKNRTAIRTEKKSKRKMIFMLVDLPFKGQPQVIYAH